MNFTCDAENDTPPVLREYANRFEAEKYKWFFLTGEQTAIDAIGTNSFGVNVDKATHSESLLVVDKFGRFRDRFTWSDSKDLERFYSVVDDLLAEENAPFNAKLVTRAIRVLIRQNTLTRMAIGKMRNGHATFC